MPNRFAHPAFDAVRPWLDRLGDPVAASHAELNRLAEEAGVRAAGGAPVRFVAPSTKPGSYGEYELQIHATGCVPTRTGNLHDVFNAIAWLAFPRTKAALNARHAEAIPRERGRRGPLRDLLTLLDEGGALVACPEPHLAALLRQRDWQALFWHQRASTASSLRVQVLGHAVLEQALDPWPGITCKALVLPSGPDADDSAARCVWDLPEDAAPRDLPPLPVFGLPGWWPGQDAAFYGDARYFRPGGTAMRG